MTPRTRTHVRRRPIPVDNAIHWKPLYDPHYVLASLQSCYQRIFVDQRALLHIQDVVRGATGRYALGLLIGKRFDCPVTGSRYALIESLVEQPSPLSDEHALTSVVPTLVEGYTARSSEEVLGWYCSRQSGENRLSDAYVAVHMASFPHAWQTILVVADTANTGAFFLHDALASKWFSAPFFEVTHPARDGGPKATCISWRDYMTVDSVVPLAPAQRSTRVQAQPAPTPSIRRPSLWRSLLGTAARARPPADITADLTAVASRSAAKPTSDRRERFDRGERHEPSVHAGREKRPAPKNDETSRVLDSDDTCVLDPVDRYIELARGEGFFVAAKFDATDATQRETLWVLNEPYSGLLVTMVSRDSEVLDASLHYNLHTEDTALLEASFSEHRDLDSRIVYVRESCVDQLRARCSRARATGNLERDWTVAAPLYFLTPAEWEACLPDAGPSRGASTLHVLNQRRIESLPDAIRRQFRLAPECYRTTAPATNDEDG